MRLQNILIASLLASSASASWFSSSTTSDEYADWDAEKLSTYLKEHNVPVPSGYSRDELAELAKANYAATASWTQDQLTAAQKVFENVQESTIDAWNDSQLRQFLVDNGIVAPASRKEQLAVLAKHRYRAYTSALSSMSSVASTAISTAIHGDATHQASKSITSGASYASASATSAAAAASASVLRALDDTKDYVWSTWSDTELRAYLEKHNFVKTKAELRRDELLKKMRGAYLSVAQPVYDEWSDSYIHDWLVHNGVIKPQAVTGREKLVALMKDNYYGAQDHVYSAWDDSQLKAWLVEHEVIKSEAELSRDKYLSLMRDYYHNAVDTVWASWHDSEIRDWLIDNGYMRSDAQLRRDELVKLINEKYTDITHQTASYLTWPDARLRAYLRNHGISDEHMPTGRPSLLHEVRIRYVQTQGAIDNVLASIRNMYYHGFEVAEEKFDQLRELVGAGKVSAEKELRRARKSALSLAHSSAASASSAASSLSSVASSASAHAEL